MGFELERWFHDEETVREKVSRIVKNCTARELEEIVKELEGKYKDKLLAEAMSIRGL